MLCMEERFNQRVEEDGILNVNLNSFKETKNLPGLKNGLLVDIDDFAQTKRRIQTHYEIELGS